MIKGRNSSRPSPCDPRRRAGAGFTLLELLVVLAIGFFLIAIFMPVLRIARDAAATTHCLSNLRQIGVALQTYSNANGGQLPPGDYYGLSDIVPWVPRPGGGNWTIILVQGGYISAPTMGLDTSGSVFRCQAAIDEHVPGYIRPPKSQRDPYGATSIARRDDVTENGVRSWYAINCSPFAPYGSLPFRMLPNDGKDDYRLTQLSQFHDASRLPLVFDGLWMSVRMERTWVNARHKNNTMSNVLMADLHAESQLTSSLPNSDWIAK